MTRDADAGGMTQHDSSMVQHVRGGRWHGSACQRRATVWFKAGNMTQHGGGDITRDADTGDMTRHDTASP